MSTAYRFRLAAVLRLRRAEYDQAELALARANRRLRELILLRNAEASRGAELGAASGTQTMAEFLAQRTSSSLAASHLLQIDAQVNVAAAEAALARLSWSGAHQRVTALERLESRRRDEWRTEQNRLETNELDELATAAFVRELQVGRVA